MKLSVCLFVLSIFITSAFSQIRNIDKRISELRALQVDTLITYYTHGDTYQYDLSKPGTCQSFNSKYLIWIKGGENFIQFFNDCFTYDPISGKMDEFINLVKKHISGIETEKIKPVQFKTKYNGKEGIGETHESETNRWDFEFYFPLKSFKKSIDSYDLLTEYAESSILGKGDSGYNINYKYNQGTYLKQLIDIATKQIKALQFKKQ